MESKTLVMKFGGASLATPAQFSKIAQLIQIQQRAFSRIIVVVSAMANTTNDLLELASQVHANPPKREVDMLLTVGERISMALLAMSLDQIGLKAFSFTGSQTGIITCSTHGQAVIVDVRPQRLCDHLNRGEIVIVAGFQGVSREREITTLGRGGSDTTAVALGVALGAEEVRFYKDVRGVYSADPKGNTAAQFYPELSYSEMEKIANSGCKVLHPRAVRLAAQNGIPLRITSFLDPSAGTLVSESGQLRSESPHYEDVPAVGGV